MPVVQYCQAVEGRLTKLMPVEIIAEHDHNKL
jgi:hypothetical protein